MKVKINGEDVFHITSKFGEQESFRSSSHKGIDLLLEHGSAVLSPVDGIIARTFDYGNVNCGKGIGIKLQNGQELIFCHLSKISVNKGDIVSVGQEIAKSGNSGFSTGSHLHIGLKSPTGQFLDPSLYERAFQKVYAMTLKGQMVAADMVTHKSQLYSAVSDILQSFN